MYAQVEKPKENKSRAVANSVAQKKSNGNQGFGFVDNRPKISELSMLQKKMKSKIPIQRNGYDADIEDNDVDDSRPLTFNNLEQLLNGRLGNNWCYVGGYACNLWFQKYGLDGDPVGDIELTVASDQIESINREIRKIPDIWDDESPDINGLTLTIFSGNEDEGVREGTTVILSPEKLIGIYNRTLMGATMKEMMGTLTPEEKEKNIKRKGRVDKLQEVLRLRN
ncbi:MAG: hypothetical protein ACJAUV_001996 [Flavobacteriales bacterium]|jgi:hypothetical protein